MREPFQEVLLVKPRLPDDRHQIARRYSVDLLDCDRSLSVFNEVDVITSLPGRGIAEFDQHAGYLLPGKLRELHTFELCTAPYKGLKCYAETEAGHPGI